MRTILLENKELKDHLAVMRGAQQKAETQYEAVNDILTSLTRRIDSFAQQETFIRKTKQEVRGRTNELSSGLDEVRGNIVEVLARLNECEVFNAASGAHIRTIQKIGAASSDLEERIRRLENGQDSRIGTLEQSQVILADKLRNTFTTRMHAIEHDRGLLKDEVGGLIAESTTALHDLSKELRKRVEKIEAQQQTSLQ